MTTIEQLRLTQYAAGGGCACKVPPGELERVLSGLSGGRAGGDLLVGLDDGDDAAAVRIDGDRAVLVTADFFTPVVDDPYEWGRIAAANALSDVYAMGGVPLVAVNLLAWAEGESVGVLTGSSLVDRGYVSVTKGRSTRSGDHRARRCFAGLSLNSPIRLVMYIDDGPAGVQRWLAAVGQG